MEKEKIEKITMMSLEEQKNKINEIVDELNNNNNIFYQQNEKGDCGQATLQFDLLYDKNAFTFATKGENYFNCLYDIYSYLRKLTKYEELEDKQYDIVEKIQEEFFDILSSHSCSIDEIE